MGNEQLRPKVGVGAVVVNKGKILLGKRKGAHVEGAWATPGGHLEFGETVEECAARELLEETGLKAVSWVLGPWVNDVMEQTKHYVTLFVFIDQVEGDLKLLEPDKCEGWEWFSLDSMPSPLFPSVQSLMKKMDIKQIESSRCGEE